MLLIAHGSRRPAANADLVTLADLLATAEPQALIEISYLELAEPGIQAGGARCVARGAGRVRMLPYFLSAGAHVVDDLREHQAQLAREFPGVEFLLCPHLGLHPLMVEIVRQRLGEVAPSPPANVS
ncbi:MAG: sirohydrochlorin chelatase [Planctomycetaceae bacterium]